MKLLSGECHRTHLMISQHIWGNGLVQSGNKPLPESMFNTDLSHHMASLGHNGLINMFVPKALNARVSDSSMSDAYLYHTSRKRSSWFLCHPSHSVRSIHIMYGGVPYVSVSPCVNIDTCLHTRLTDGHLTLFITTGKILHVVTSP